MIIVIVNANHLTISSMSIWRKMKKNIISEVIQYLVHVIRLFFGFSSNYHMRGRKHRKLSQRLSKFVTVNHRSIEEPETGEPSAKKIYPYPGNTSQ
jgi:hypothetical protein